MYGPTFWRPQCDSLSSIFIPAAEKLQQIPACSAFWNLLAGRAKWMQIALSNFETKTDDRGLQILDYLFSLSSIMGCYFAFIVKELRALFGTAVRRRNIFLWTDGIVIKSSGKNKAFLLLLICLIFWLCCLHLWHLLGFSTGHAACAVLYKVHNVRTVCCWTHSDLVQWAGNKSSACSGCQWHPISYSGIVEHTGAAVILLL